VQVVVDNNGGLRKTVPVGHVWVGIPPADARRQRTAAMKTGRTLQQLAAELERQTASRRDYIAPQGKVEAVVVTETTEKVGEVINGHVETETSSEIKITGFNGDALALTNYAHGQLADHLEIPRKYYDRTRSLQPELLAENINTWLRADPANKRMIRTLDGRVRGILSPKFRPLDNFDLAGAVLPTLIEHEVEITSCELTETRMYIKGILPALSDVIPAGLALGEGHNALDRGTVVAAVVISNSDIGNGTLRVEPSVFTTFCTNLAILKDAAMRKYHAGRANQTTGETWEVFADDTRKADDAAFWLKVRDVTKAAFDADQFRAAVARIRKAANTIIPSDDIAAVVEMTIEELKLPTSTNGGILKALAAGGDMTQWGLSSALTRVANTQADYETATLLERAGGEVLALQGGAWKRIAEATAA
jgi:hypothetical protein